MSESLNFSDKDKREENIRFLYSKAIDARNFHYDNFTKWQTFFYIAVGSVLVAYCTLLTTEECRLSAQAKLMYPFLLRLLPVLGYAFSLIWLCSSRGYTLWWNAYMSLLRRFEGENVLGWDYNDCGKPKNTGKNKSYAVFNGPKFKSWKGVFNPFAGTNFSTSRLSNALAFISTSAWGSVFLAQRIGTGNMSPCCWILVLLSPILFTWIVSSPIVQFFFASDIKDFAENAGRDAGDACLGCFIIVFSHATVLVLVILLALCAAEPPRLCLARVAAYAELWLFLSVLLSLSLRKAWEYLNWEKS